MFNFKDNSIKKILLVLCCLISFLLIALFAVNIVFFAGALLSTDSEYTPLSNSMIFGIIELLLILVIIVLVYLIYSYVRKVILSPLSTIKSGIGEVKNGNSDYKLDITSNNEIGEIACAINDITGYLQESKNKLKVQSEELYDKNWELQEANSELEASYGQLQAIIEQLNEAEQKYHSLVRNIPEIVCVIEDTGVISFVNHVCYDVLGYEKSDLVGKNISELIAAISKPFSIEYILNYLKHENIYATELSFVRKDGITIITEVKFTNYMYNGISMGLQAIVRDITKRRRLEKEILQSNKELSILNSTSKALTSTLDLDELSNIIVNEITQALDCPSCALGFIEKDTSSLYVKALSGTFYANKNIDTMFIPKNIHDSAIKYFAEKSGILKAHEIPDSWVTSTINSSLPEDEKIKEFLFMPVSVKDKQLGILITGFNSPIGEHQINLISSIANNVAVAIENALLYETSKKYFIKTVDALIATVEAKDDYTEGHSQRVSKYAVDIAEKLGLSKDQIQDIKIAGILHDIGKVGISDSILLKPEKLTSEEYEVIKQHPLISNKILYPVGFSERTMKAIALHHERFDGTGYPYGLSGSDISIEAQIIAVADAYDAMTSSRSYRKPMSRLDALNELLANRNTQFNPIIVDTFVDIAKRYRHMLY
ncbi:MAG: HD domain-containing protein [Clostridia bacterium]|nr:HD domain-containing protein [Clostridia bacterium]